MASPIYKIPQSVLVIIHTAALDVLMMRRTRSATSANTLAEDTAPEAAAQQEEFVEFWQCVTGSKDKEKEDFADTAVREVLEETGIDVQAAGHQLRDWYLENIYTIYPQWLHRYAPGVAENTEHVFSLQVPAGTAVRLNPREHTALEWLPWQKAAQRCYAASNAEAILLLPQILKT